MTEMLPETWRLEMSAASGCCPHAKHPRRGMITDILVWVDCYASMAAILSSAYPEKAPHLLAHFRTVVRAAGAWATYDAVCRRQAANRGSLDWGAIDNTLYSEAFTGRARVVPRCSYCLDDTHASHECSFAPVPASGNQPTAWGATSDLRRAASRPIQPARAAPRPAVTQDICRLFNANMCRFQRCKYAHICSRCHLPHPAVDCDRSHGSARSRTPLPAPRT